MSNFALRRFRLSGDWHRLFERLPGWHLDREGVWTDELSVVELSQRLHGIADFGFVLGAQENWAEFLSQLPNAKGLGLNAELPTAVQITTPSGINVSFQQERNDPNDHRDHGLTFMNHVAVNVTDITSERRWYEELLGDHTVLARDSAWEPVSRSFVRDVHIFASPAFYITIRETKDVSRVDHVGWMAKDCTTVDEMAAIVKKLGWPIVFGPAEIDGSYLFHFAGPDKRVHDFFFPTAPLIQASQREHELGRV